MANTTAPLTFRPTLADARIIAAIQKRTSRPGMPTNQSEAIRYALAEWAQYNLMDCATLAEMVKDAQENWDFANYASSDDPDDVERGEAVRLGLAKLAQIAAAGDEKPETVYDHVKHPEDWDGLEEWAAYMGEK